MTTWQTKKLGDVLEKIEGGGTPSKEKKEFWNGSIPWASVKDLTSFNPKETQDYITDEGLRNSSSRLVRAGTLITPTRMALGFTVRFDVDVAINQDLKALYPIDDMSTEFVQYWFEAHRKTIERLGTGSTVTGIQVGELRALKIQVPEKPEQQRIVSVLGVWDEYIEKLEQKIALKEQLKRGLMQQLLTGKRRLPGFSGEWKATTIGDVSAISMGQSPSSSSYNNSGNGLVLIQGNADMKNGLTVERVWTTEVTKEAPKGSLIMTVRAPVGEIAVATQKVCLGRGVCAIKSDYSNYLRIYLDWFKPKWLQFIQGSTFESVNGTDVRKLKIRLPETEEASSIVSVIGVVEDEIEVMKSICNNTKLQKKYLLKNLITGTIRTPETLKPHGVNS